MQTENPDTNVSEQKQASDTEAKSNLSISKNTPSLPEKYIFISVTGNVLDYKASANLSFIEKFDYLVITLKHLTEQNELLLLKINSHDLYAEKNSAVPKED